MDTGGGEGGGGADLFPTFYVVLQGENICFHQIVPKEVIIR